MTLLRSQIEAVKQFEPRRIVGSVHSMRGTTILVNDLPLPVGALVRIDKPGCAPAHAEVIGFDGPRAIIMLLGAAPGIGPGMAVVGERTSQTVLVGQSMVGRIVDGLGRPIDGGRALRDGSLMPLRSEVTPALNRTPIVKPLPTGVRAIDAMLTVGVGQRVGIFSAAGVGKSTLIASIAKHSRADVNVIALIGERGREVREFIERSLGEEGLARSVVVVATGDESPLLRVRAALAAAAIAEYFRDRGAAVALLMDSMTRYAQALRQIGLAVGEQPATRGYTPSVFAEMPSLLERAGAIEGSGAITGFYAVLVEGDDLNEPVSDTVRGVLDGHIVLSRRIASLGRYPAIDVLESISRVADQVCDRNHIDARRRILRLLAAYRENEELINIGAYSRGSNPETDTAIALKPHIEALLTQDAADQGSYPATCRSLIELANAAQQHNAAASSHGAQVPAGRTQ